MRSALAVVALALALGDGSLKELEQQLKGGDRRLRREAVIGLAKLDVPDAWKLVVEVLDDPLSQVADEAQLQIAAIDDDAGRELLLGKEGLGAKDAMVRARVAEAFGRMQSPPGAKAMLAGLGDKDPLVRRETVWSIERLRAADKWPGAPPQQLAAAIANDKDTGVQAAALVALGEFADEDAGRAAFAKERQAAIGRSAYELRAAALIGGLDRDARASNRGSAAAAAKDTHVSVRLCAAELFAWIGQRDDARELVEMLGAESQLRARWRVLDLLRGMSGLKHGPDPRPWRDWANALPDTWQAGTATVPAVDADEQSTTVTLAGLPILSDRVCFVIDLSGSVWQLGTRGKTKKKLIDEEFTKTLRALPPKTQFNLIVYTAKPVAWQSKLVPATEKNVAAALEFFTERTDNGTGNFWDAYLLALEDPTVDTVVNFSDGAPTGGDRWNLGLMRELMREKNRFRRVALDAVLTDPREELVKHWQGMCADSGGRLVRFSLE